MRNVRPPHHIERMADRNQSLLLRALMTPTVGLTCPELRRAALSSDAVRTLQVRSTRPSLADRAVFRARLAVRLSCSSPTDGTVQRLFEGVDATAMAHMNELAVNDMLAGDRAAAR